MAVQLKGQSTWEAEAAKSRAATEARLYAATKLRPDDEVRFKPTGKKSWAIGKPVDVNADGSITVSTKFGLRSLLPEVLQVKMPGPRKGFQWVPLETGA